MMRIIRRKIAQQKLARTQHARATKTFCSKFLAFCARNMRVSHAIRASEFYLMFSKIQHFETSDIKFFKFGYEVNVC